MKQAASSASSNAQQSNNLIGGFSIFLFGDEAKKFLDNARKFMNSIFNTIQSKIKTSDSA
jgi:hypothetical protein